MIDDLFATRCDPPACVRVIGHRGHCRPSWQARSAVLCGTWLPNVKEPCARRAGHSTVGNSGAHRSRAALDYDRDRSWRRYHDDGLAS